MVTLMVGTFIFGYILIAIEHKIQINKAAVAVTLGMLLWVMYIYAGNSLIMGVNSDAFKQFLSVNPEYASLPIGKQCIKFISESQIIHYLGEQVQIIFYLIGAMTIVELVDVHGGFTCITDRIKTRNKRKLLWIISFFLLHVGNTRQSHHGDIDNNAVAQADKREKREVDILRNGNTCSQ